MPGKSDYAELTVAAEMEFTGLIREVARKVAEPARLPERRLRRMELAVEEAFINAVEHAYEGGPPGLVTLVAERLSTSLVLSIRDAGIPFDASLEAARGRQETFPPERKGSPGRGLPFIRSIMDEVEWIGLGTGGKEIRMTLRLEPAPGEGRVDASGPKVGETPTRETPAGGYTIRRLRPEDAIGVSRCAYRAYGHSYPSSHLYHPREIVEMNESGALISAVAVSDLTGEVVGHSSLQPYPSGIHAESGQTVVSHAHRGQRLTSRILEFVEGEAFRAGLRCLVCHEVTRHPAMQIVSHRAGYNPCGLALGAMPATLDFRRIAGPRKQRESCMVSMKFLSSPEPAVISVPRHHREMIRRIYASLGRPVTFEALPLPSGPGKTVVWHNKGWGIGDIHVHGVGRDSLAEIRRALADLRDIGHAEAVYLALPLDQGGTEELCRAAEAEGFFFVGLGPSGATRGEALYLQHLDTILDVSLIQVATPEGREIFEYVARERERVSTPGTRS